MILSVGYFMAVLIAWGISLTMIRMRIQGIIFHSVLAAAICGFAAFLMGALGLESHIGVVCLIIFLLGTAMVQLQLKGNYGDAVLALLTALSIFALLTWVYNNSIALHNALLLPVPPVFWGLFIGLTVKLKTRFPDADWRDYFTNAAPEPGRMNIKKGHVYVIAGLACFLNCSAMLVTADTAAKVLLVGMYGACVFWLGILLIIFVTAYKKERIAVLVEQQYRNEMGSFMNVIRSQRHDYNFHVQTIAGLIQDGKIEECRKYVHALEHDASVMNAMLPVRDPAISALIHNFQMLAVREGIELHIDIQNDLSQIATNVYETNKIISNLLQNAIDETVTHQDKSYGIRLCILKRGEYCIIRVSNVLENKVMTAESLGRLYQQGYTTKNGHDGVGLSSIRVLASRYRGTIYTQIEGDVISFIAKIPINYAKEEPCA